MRNRFAKPFNFIGLVTIFSLGFMASRVVLSPLDGIKQFLQNPFGISTRVAPSGPVVLEQIQRLERLETCRYNGNVIVRGDTSGTLPVWLVGDRMLFVGHGEVVAGIDLSRLRAEDVQVQDGHVSVRLPLAEILHTKLDNRQSEVFERQTGLFSKPDIDLETKVRVEAEDRIRQAALESGVLKTAQENARQALRRHLALAGVEDVSFL